MHNLFMDINNFIKPREQFQMQVRKVIFAISVHRVSFRGARILTRPETVIREKCAASRRRDATQRDATRRCSPREHN